MDEVEKLLNEYFKEDERARKLAIKLFRVFYEEGATALKTEVKKLVEKCEEG